MLVRIEQIDIKTVLGPSGPNPDRPPVRHLESYGRTTPVYLRASSIVNVEPTTIHMAPDWRPVTATKILAEGRLYTTMADIDEVAAMVNEALEYVND